MIRFALSLFLFLAALAALVAGVGAAWKGDPAHVYLAYYAWSLAMSAAASKVLDR